MAFKRIDANGQQADFPQLANRLVENVESGHALDEGRFLLKAWLSEMSHCFGLRRTDTRRQ
jgi:hypothetical protein